MMNLRNNDLRDLKAALAKKEAGDNHPRAQFWGEKILTQVRDKETGKVSLVEMTRKDLSEGFALGKIDLKVGVINKRSELDTRSEKEKRQEILDAPQEAPEEKPALNRDEVIKKLKAARNEAFREIKEERKRNKRGERLHSAEVLWKQVNKLDDLLESVIQLKRDWEQKVLKSRTIS